MRRYRFLLPVLILGFCILFSAACQVQPSQFTAKADPHESIEQITETFDATCNDIFSEDERRSMETAAQTTSPTASAKSPAAVIDADPSDRTVKAVTSSEEDPIKDTTEKSTRQPDSTKTSQSEQEPIKTTKSTATTAKKTTIPETALESTFIEETTVTAETKPSPKPTTTPTPAPGSEPPLSDEKMAKEIFKYLSQYRVENGLPEFKEGEPRMWEAAQIRRVK